MTTMTSKKVMELNNILAEAMKMQANITSCDFRHEAGATFVIVETVKERNLLRRFGFKEVGA